MLPGLFYVWIEALLCTTTAPCDKPANGRCRTPERSDGGPEGPKAAGLSNVGHRQALNTKNPRGFADGGFLLPVKKYLQRRLIFQIYDLAHSDKL